jgi:hypothetical protein
VASCMDDDVATIMDVDFSVMGHLLMGRF